MKKRILLATLVTAVTALALPVFAQIPGGAIPKDSAQIRDDDHDFRPDRVDQRSSSVGMTANEARDLRQAQIREMKKQRKLEKAQRTTTPPPADDK